DRLCLYLRQGAGLPVDLSVPGDVLGHRPGQCDVVHSHFPVDRPAGGDLHPAGSLRLRARLAREELCASLIIGESRSAANEELTMPAQAAGRAAETWAMNVITLASRKGGAGKTTLTAHLAAFAHRQGHRCLVIDADPQGSLSLWHSRRPGGQPALASAAQ